jgi:hypothetical protein
VLDRRLHVVWLQRRRRRRGKLETVILELVLHCVRLGSPLKRLYTVVICTYFISSARPVTTIRTE